MAFKMNRSGLNFGKGTGSVKKMMNHPKNYNSPTDIGPLAAMAGKAIMGAVANKVAQKATGSTQKMAAPEPKFKDKLIKKVKTAVTGKDTDAPGNYGHSTQKMADPDSPQDYALQVLGGGARALQAIRAAGGIRAVIANAPKISGIGATIRKLISQGAKFATIGELYSMAKNMLSGKKDDENAENTENAENAENTENKENTDGRKDQTAKDNPPSGSGSGSGDKMPDSDWKKGQDKAKEMGTDLDALVKKRKTLEKGSDEWKRNQNLINEALGNSKRYDVGPAEKETPKPEATEDNSGKLPDATEKTDAVDTTIRPDMTVNVRQGGPAGSKKFEFQTADGTPSGMREKERKTKGKSDISFEGKKIKQRNYDEQGNLEEKYRRTKGGAEGGMADDYYSDKMKKRKVTVKDGDKVTKTKTKYNKDGTVKRQVTKTRKRRFVNLGRKLAGKRAGQRTAM